MTEATDLPNPDASIPEPIAPSLALSGIPEPLAEAMRRRGFEGLTTVQQAVLDAESEGRDLRISSQTGSGKTVAIGLGLAGHLARDRTGSRPAGPSVLVLVPTRELAMQVREELAWLLKGLRVGIEVVMGGTSLGLERRALSGRPQIVVGTPGRTLDHLKTGAFSAEEVAHVVLDESDRMLDMGFREELEAILERMPTERRTHLVSATFPSAVLKLADRFQRDALHIQGTRLGDANRDIQHVAHVVSKRDTYGALVNLLLLGEGERCLVFVERRVDASALADRLSGDGFAVQAFSGELAQAQRTRTINAFREGSIKTLISTDVAARGIDVPDIERVIHLDLPSNADAYVHRSGRTGRAGRAGHSVMIVRPEGRRFAARLFGMARIEAEWTPAPSAGKVRKQLRSRFRRQVRERLAGEEAPKQNDVDYAKGLLDGRDPAEVVALLLDLAQPAAAHAPMEISESPTAEPSGARASTHGFVRFKINWGERGGAATNRILGHVCRRGQIRGHLVGAIEVGPDESSFDVVDTVAARFEKLARKPDARDPKLRIERAQSRPARGPRKPGAGQSQPRVKRKGPGRPR